jgi:hypothetical protein
VKFDVTLASLGTIDGIINASTDTSILNGLQLRAVHVVPEPTTFSMVSLFGGALFFIRRRITS